MDTASLANRRSPVAASLNGGDGLSLLPDLVKLGVKGPKLNQWALSHGIELPALLYG